MSLVVAKKFGEKLFVVSDTKIDNPNNLNRIFLTAPEQYSLIKSVIINPFVCISYAGEIDLLKEALPICRNLGILIDRIVNYLSGLNVLSDQKIEFIVAVNIPPFLIYSIKDGVVTQTESAWIGDKEGFNEFQKNFVEDSLGVGDDDPLRRMENAMVSAIESNVRSVNGFIIQVTNETWQFLYKHYIRTYILPTIIFPRQHVSIGHGSVQKGGYTVNIFPNTSTDMLIVHVLQNKLGIIYKLQANGMLEPEVYRDHDEHAFIEKTIELYGIDPGYIISNRQQSFFERGNAAVEKKEFEAAINFYNKGLAEKENSLYDKLHFNKGVCYFHWNKINDSIVEFKKAIEINPSMWPKYLQFMSQFNRPK